MQYNLVFLRLESCVKVVRLILLFLFYNYLYSFILISLSPLLPYLSISEPDTNRTLLPYLSKNSVILIKNFLSQKFRFFFFDSSSTFRRRRGNREIWNINNVRWRFGGKPWLRETCCAPLISNLLYDFALFLSNQHHETFFRLCWLIVLSLGLYLLMGCCCGAI